MKTSNKFFIVLLSVIFISIITTMVVPFVISFTFSGEIKGNGVHAEKTYNLPNFNAVNIETAGDIKIVIGDMNKIQISGDSNLLPYVLHQINNKTLTLKENKNIVTDLPLKIIITTKNLNKFILNGAGNIHLLGINNRHFSIESNGFGNIVATGKTDNLKIKSNGAVNINCKNLIADNVSLNAAGVGNVTFYAKHILNATATGIGSVTYYGNPKHIIKSDGTGIGWFGPAKEDK
ncbi:MAG: DUF2807 domain-containing protein [bacterium]|nr:DUF2807 domain-containing protein [bacterium]